MKKKIEDDDPDWKNGLYVGKADIGAVSDIEAYKAYATEMMKKSKDFLLFSQWRESQKK